MKVYNKSINETYSTKIQGLPQDGSSGIFCKSSIAEGGAQPASIQERELMIFCQQSNPEKKVPNATCPRLPLPAQLAPN